MIHFYKERSEKKVNKHVLARRNRLTIKGFRNSYKIVPGDVLSIYFRNQGLLYSFDGICISVKSKNFINPESSIILRNVLSSISVELTVSFYYLRIFFSRFDDYKRKKFSYTRSKLFFLRKKLNKYSRVK
jgi:ribosomal protein L19